MTINGAGYARVYNKYFTGFVRSAREVIASYFDQRRDPGIPASLLDVCCGTGQLACYFATRGYRVFAVDNSPEMLTIAKQSFAQLQDDGDACFLNVDATSFELPERVSFATATTNALCSMPDLTSLSACFTRVRAVIRDGGVFVFDMNTRAGMQQTNMITVRELADEFFIVRTIYDPALVRMIARTSGFVRSEDAGEDGRWERFENTAIETAYRVDDILSALSQAGWRSAYPAALSSLAEPLEDPEAAARCFYVAEA
jgi:SAM-dependent methyltransferase